MKIQIPYWIIVKSTKLCEELQINEYCVSEWIVDAEDTTSITITKDKKWILDELKNLVD